MTTGLRLITEARERDAMIVAAASWAEEIDLCTPAIDSHLGRWTVWQALIAAGPRVRHACVALEGLRSEPHALDELHRLGALRFIPAADGSFRPNLLRFRRGDQVRILLGSGALVPAGMMAPLEAVTYWQGEELSRFALEVERLLQRALELAHVAEPEELATYADLYFQAAPEREAIGALAAPMVRRMALDADVHDLEVVTEARDVRRAVLTMKAQFSGGATRSVEQDLGFRGGNMSGTLHWTAPLGMWSLYTKGDGTFLNMFGRDYPDPSRALQITVQATVPFEGVNRKVGAAVARDRETGRTFLVHRGRIGGGRKGIGAELFWSRFRGGTAMREPDRDEPSRVVVMGEVGSAGLPRDVAAFVHEVGRIKASGV